MRTIAVDGLTWEVPDHYQHRAACADEQRAFADCYDQDASRWELRVQTAWEVLEAGLEALTKPLSEEPHLHTMREKGI